MTLFDYYEQKGSGVGVDSLEGRDVESVLSDPFSKIVGKPTDEKSIIMIHIFNSTPYEYGQHGLIGFKYEALKDSIKWIGLKPKDYVPNLLSCINHYIKGVNSKT